MRKMLRDLRVVLENRVTRVRWCEVRQRLPRQQRCHRLAGLRARRCGTAAARLRDRAFRRAVA